MTLTKRRTNTIVCEGFDDSTCPGLKADAAGPASTELQQEVRVITRQPLLAPGESSALCECLFPISQVGSVTEEIPSAVDAGSTDALKTDPLSGLQSAQEIR